MELLKRSFISKGNKESLLKSLVKDNNIIQVNGQDERRKEGADEVMRHKWQLNNRMKKVDHQLVLVM